MESRDCTCTAIRHCDGYGNTLVKGSVLEADRVKKRRSR